MASPDIERTQISAAWHARGFSCDLWIDPPGQEWIDYVHSVDELVMLMDGEIELTMQGRRFRPAVGDEVFIPARVAHTVRNVGGTTARWFYGYKRD